MNNLGNKNILRELAIFAIALVLAVMFWQNNILLTSLLIFLYVARQYQWSAKGDNIIYISGIILGCTAEFIGTHLGVWTYSAPLFLNIPLWLPFAWGLVSVIIIRVSLPFIES
ncbi:hypothetical protein [Methanococcoides sp. AM1]|uniref:hypothetical protein n=1 Tax=Methanococcoides sp. AM1 TaxID=1201011 RepID=UPI0010835918|nr:hypothetical protein [Methanococcoides sp. AM1]